MKDIRDYKDETDNFLSIGEGITIGAIVAGCESLKQQFKDEPLTGVYLIVAGALAAAAYGVYSFSKALYRGYEIISQFISNTIMAAITWTSIQSPLTLLLGGSVGLLAGLSTNLILKKKTTMNAIGRIALSTLAAFGPLALTARIASDHVWADKNDVKCSVQSPSMPGTYNVSNFVLARSNMVPVIIPESYGLQGQYITLRSNCNRNTSVIFNEKLKNEPASVSSKFIEIEAYLPIDQTNPSRSMEGDRHKYRIPRSELVRLDDRPDLALVVLGKHMFIVRKADLKPASSPSDNESTLLKSPKQEFRSKIPDPSQKRQTERPPVLNEEKAKGSQSKKGLQGRNPLIESNRYLPLRQQQIASIPHSAKVRHYASRSARACRFG